VVVYAKLPKDFYISTPVGNYNPDWAISFKEGVVNHVYFVAETKGSMSSMELRKSEDFRIDCATKFFKALNELNAAQVRYEKVDSYGALMALVKK
jgi:type III restriction enzyme